MHLERVEVKLRFAIAKLEVECVGRSRVRARFYNKLESIFGPEGLARYRAHLIRDRIVSYTVNRLPSSLKSHQCLERIDYAMKMLPAKWRELQSDAFAKVGISWAANVVQFLQSSALRQ